MAVLKTALEGLLKEHARTQHELLETQRVRQEKFEQDVQAALARLETRGEHEKKSPRGGLTFEAAVSSFVQEAVNGGAYVVEETGSRTGARQGCKVGDVVVQFTADSAFDGSAIVIEAKQDRSYTVAKALSEMEVARSNRGAEAGVFVLAGMHAPNWFPSCARYGKDILVTWDCEDPHTDPYLRAALLTALGLASRQQKNANEGDIRALEDVAQRIEAEIARLGKMRSHNDKIRKGSDDIADEIHKGENKLDLLLRKSGEVLKALSVEIRDEEAERRSPITLPNSSMAQASAPIESSDTAEIV